MQLGQLARGVVAVALDAAVEADFFDEVVGRVVGEAGGGALWVGAGSRLLCHSGAINWRSNF